MKSRIIKVEKEGLVNYQELVAKYLATCKSQGKISDGVYREYLSVLERTVVVEMEFLHENPNEYAVLYNNPWVTPYPEQVK